MIAIARPNGLSTLEHLDDQLRRPRRIIGALSQFSMAFQKFMVGGSSSGPR
jgi:hypothetical protein